MTDFDQAMLNMTMMEVRARRAVVINAQRQVAEAGHFVLGDTGVFAALDIWTDEFQMVSADSEFVPTPDQALVLAQLFMMNKEAVDRLVAKEPVDQSQALIRKLIVLNTLAMDLPLTKYVKKILRETDIAEQELMMAEPNLTDPVAVEEFISNGYDLDEAIR